MNSVKWYDIDSFYNTNNHYKITHKRKAENTFVKLSCVYFIKINDNIVHVGRSDTCKKHGGAEKVRKAIVNLLNINQYNPSVPKTKVWDKIRLKHRPNSSNIRIGIIKTKNVSEIYTKESSKTY